MSQQDKDGKFPWESAVPTGPFWTSLAEPAISRKVLRIWTADELAAMNLDEKADLDLAAKLELIESMLLALPPLGPPETLSHHDFEEVWHHREDLLAHIERNLGGERVARCEARCKEMIRIWAERKDPEKKWAVDMAEMDMLLVLYKNEGRYEEALEIGWDLVAATRESPALGYESPMNLGIMKKQMDTLMKLGRYDEALKLNTEGYDVAKAMGQSKFAKYEVEMVEDLNKLRAEIATAKAGVIAASA